MQHPKSGPPRSFDPWDGLLLIDKPSGPTSHDIVAVIRRHFGIKKVGHGGTLDPMATGLLVILLGRGTKLSNHLLGSDKTYEGTMQLGVATDSQDRDGKIIEERDPSAVTKELLETEMSKWIGDVMQTPPMVSAIKKDGVPLYKLARKGETVKREPRFLHIYDFALTHFAHPSADFRLKCTKGTYVRTLCADIGEALGCGAHLTALRRTQSGALSLDHALTLDTALSYTLKELQEHIIHMHQYVVDSHLSL